MKERDDKKKAVEHEKAIFERNRLARASREAGSTTNVSPPPNYMRKTEATEYSNKKFVLTYWFVLNLNRKVMFGIFKGELILLCRVQWE